MGQLIALPSSDDRASNGADCVVQLKYIFVSRDVCVQVFSLVGRVCVWWKGGSMDERGVLSGTPTASLSFIHPSIVRRTDNDHPPQREILLEEVVVVDAASHPQGSAMDDGCIFSYTAMLRVQFYICSFVYLLSVMLSRISHHFLPFVNLDLLLLSTPSIIHPASSKKPWQTDRSDETCPMTQAAISCT